jgi:ABC-type phosphate transport system permease subunit
MGLLTTAICALVVLIAAALLARSWPLLTTYSLGELLTSQSWHPLRGEFGFAPFIAGSMAVTLVAIVFSVVPAIFSGIYLAEYMSTRTRGVLKMMAKVIHRLWKDGNNDPLIMPGSFPMYDGDVRNEAAQAALQGGS